MENEKYKLD